MSDIDAKLLAEAVVSQLQEQRKEFWVNPEDHYNDHQSRIEWKREDYNDLASLITIFRTTKSLVGKAFVGLAVLGLAVLLALGVFKGVPH